MSESAESRFVEIEGLRLHYREAGEGDPLLLLHGFPTSSHLWRNVIPRVSDHRRVLALDLPGFGLSDKPTDVWYGFGFHERVLQGFLDKVGAQRTALAVHDLGGPIGLYWAVKHPERLSHLALLNTLVYPETSWAVKLFVLAARTPLVRDWLASPAGITAGLRLGVERKERLTPEVMAGYTDPFRERAARRGLLRAGIGLSPSGLATIGEALPSLDVPVRIIYGENDRILPDVAQTMQRVARDLPQAKITSLRSCGHFLQEDEPKEIGRILSEFLS